MVVEVVGRSYGSHGEGEMFSKARWCVKVVVVVSFKLVHRLGLIPFR